MRIFLEILFFIFLVLKLTDLINWSWWWVTCPIWAGSAFVIIALIIRLIILYKNGKR